MDWDTIHEIIYMGISNTLNISNPEILRTVIGIVGYRGTFNTISIDPNDFRRRRSTRSSIQRRGLFVDLCSRVDDGNGGPLGRYSRKDLVQSGQLIAIGGFLVLH